MVTKVAVNLEMQATGLKSATDQASKLNAELANAQGNAAKTSKALAAAKQASRPVGAEYTEYGRGRAGREGGTGASARDFANQAQGLGGLVRLYATYAANIFAVGAAFNALSAAMDTTNMIKGLNQLGAASGTALGSLSQELVNATDGAVSLREAMEATVKASSSGMSNKDIIRMGEAAQKASLALGVNMSDALSRMSRGITKLEPELLDELGIFVRVDDAAAEYAKSVGKAASELTGFERRMAFANATLEQAEKKFGAIDIESNPYTQLLATIKNAAQSIGESLNVVLVPLVKLLSSSPMALTTVITGLTALLVKQAIPAFGQLRESMLAAVDESAAVAQKRLEDFKRVDAERRKSIEQLATQKAEAEVDAVDKAEARLKSFDSTRLSKTSKLAQSILDQSLDGVNKVSEEQLKKLDSVAKGLETKGNKAEAALYKEITSSIRAWKAAEEERLKVIAQNKAEMESAGKSTLNYIIAERARNAAISQSIISNTAYVGSTNGVSIAIKEMNKQISEAGLTGFDKFKTQAMGTMGAIAGRIGTVISAVSGFIQGIGVAIAVIGMMDMAFSAAGKEIKEFNSTVDKATDVSEGLARTIETIYKDTSERIFNTKALKAYGTALQEISGTIDQLASKMKAAQDKMSWWDKGKDLLLGLFNQDMADDFADGMETMLDSALKNVRTPDEASNLRSKIADALNLDSSFSMEQFNAAMEKAADSRNYEAIKRVEEAFKELGLAAQIAASGVEDFDEALKTAKESYKEFADQYKTKDPVQKLGESIISMGTKMQKALETPEVALQKLADISKDINSIALFSEKDQANLITYGAKLQDLAQKQDAYTRKLKEQKAEQDKLATDYANKYNKAKNTTEDMPGTNIAIAERDAAATAFAKQSAAVEETKRLLDAVGSESKTLLTKFDNISGRSFANGAALIAKSIEAAAGAAGAEMKRGIASGLGDLSGAAALQAEAIKAELGSKANLLQVQEALVKATYENTQAIKINTLTQELALSKSYAPEEGAKRRAAGVRDPAVIQAQIDAEKMALNAVNGNKAAEKSIRDLGNVAEGSSPALQQVSASAMGVIQSISGIRSELAKLGVQGRLADLDKQAKEIKENQRDDERRLSDQKQIVDSKLKELDHAKELNGYLTEAQIAQKNSLELEQLRLSTKIEQSKLAAEIAAKEVYVKEAEAKYGKQNESAAKARASLELETAAKKRKEEESAKTEAQLKEKHEKNRQDREAKAAQFRLDTMAMEKEAQLAQEESYAKAAEYKFSMLEASGMLSESEAEAHKLSVLRIQEQANLKRKLYELELGYIRQVNDVLAQATLDNIEDTQDRMLKLTDAYTAAVNQAQLDSKGKILLEETKISNKPIIEFKKQLTDGLTESIVTALFEGSKEGGKKMKDVLTNILRNTLSKILNDALGGFVNGLVGSFTGGAGKSVGNSLMNGASNMLTGGGGWGNLAAGTAMNAVGASAAGYATAVPGLTSSAAGSQAAMLAAQTAEFGGAGVALTAQAGGSSAAGAAAAGYNALAAIPVWGWVAIAAIALWKPLFGRKLKEYGTKMNFGPEGQVEASAYKFEKGGLFRSDKTTNTDLDPATKTAVETQMRNLRQSAIGMAEMLGLGSDAVKNFTGEISVNFKGAKDDAERAKRVEEAYRKAKAQMLATAHINEAGHIKQKELEATQNKIREQAMRDAEMKIREASKESGKSAAEIEKDVSSASDKIEEAGSSALDNLLEAGNSMEELSQEQLNNINMLRDAEKAKSKEFEDLTNHYVEVIKKADEAMASAGISAEGLGSIIRDAMLGRISGEEAGQALSDQILDGIYNTIASGYANQIGAMIIEQIVQPMFVSIMQTGTISATVSQASIDATINTAMAAVNAFKQILDDPRFQAAMQQLSGAMSQIGKVAGSSAGSIRTRTSSMSYLNNRANEAAEAAKKRAEERLSLEKELLGILGDTNKLREIELRDIDASNRALKKQIWAIEDAKKGVEDAMSTLERSIEKRKEQLQEELDLATEARDMAKDVFDTLKDSIEDILGTSAKAMRVDEARKLISQAISTGILPDADKLSGAIDVLKDKVENDKYGSRADQKRASLRLANELKLLQGVAEPQLTEAEKQVKALEEQITQLDKQLEYAQQQVDALFGIDSSVLEVAIAVDRLNTAMTGYKSQINIGAGMVGSGKTIPGTYRPVLPPDSPTAQWTADGYWKNNLDLRNMYNANSASILSQYGSRDAYLQWHYENFGQAEGRKFKNGGSYLGGLAMVGENGPELINFREPGMVYTAAQTRNLLDTNGMSEEEVALLRELVTEIKMMRYETQATAMHTNKTYRILDRVTKSGQAVQTQEVPPTP